MRYSGKADVRAGCLAVAVLAVGVLAVTKSEGGPDKPFPDEWFFSGADRPAELRDLEGKPAAEIEVMQWIGDETSLKKLRGQVVVLDFWATWCGPCMAAIPENIELYDKYQKDGLAFIGIHDTDNGWDDADDVVRDKGINYPIARDAAGGKSIKSYNLSFWPTYVVIDREGIVRGAGLIPSYVEDAVKQLLSEPYAGSPSSGEATIATGFPDEWFYGGEKRPADFRAIENKSAVPITGAAWTPDEPRPRAWARKVKVIQFVRPEFAYSMTHLERIKEIVRRFTPQGVVFVAVCDARSDWDRMLEEMALREITWTAVHDSPLPEDQPGGGITTQAYGVSFGPATVVIDRAGVVRAAGLKTEHLEQVINTLMAERLPARTEPANDSNDDSTNVEKGSDH